MEPPFTRLTDHQIDQLKSVSKENLFRLKRYLKASYTEIDRLQSMYNILIYAFNYL